MQLDPGQGRRVGRWVGLAARRAAISVIGGAVAIAGIVMLFTPGPGLGLLAAGLAILATEYAWAHRMLTRVRARSRAAYERARASVQTRRTARSATRPGRDRHGGPQAGGPTAI